MADAHPIFSKQFPYRISHKDAGLCEWLTNTAENFTEPFFDESISRLRSAAAHQHKFESLASLEMLPGWAAALELNRSPDAFIFHVSRCGSTLLSQLLALQQSYMVLSEVPFLDELLRQPFKNLPVNSQTAGTYFHAALQFYINSSPQQPQKIFIKNDSWHLHFYEQLKALYPEVPFILLYRDPWEVLQSQQKRRGMQSVPGIVEPSVFKFTPAEASTYDLDKYMSLVLHSYFTKMIAIAAADDHCLLINYNEGAVAAMNKIASATGIDIDKNYERIILERAGYHAKYPGELFKEERSDNTAPDFLSPALALYKQLEEIRVKKAST